MLLDDLREKLKTIEPHIATIKTFWANSPLEQEFKQLTHEVEQENFWQNTHQTEILKKLQSTRLVYDQYQDIIQSFGDMNELIELFAQDEQELQKLSAEIGQLNKKVALFKVQLLLDGAQDSSSCFLSVNSGAGGTESQDWAETLLRMYVRFCEREKLPAAVVDYQAGEGAGIKSATLYIQGKNAYGLLKGEHGIHRLVRISPYDANKRRHTSFSGIFVTAEVPDVEIVIDPNDLRIDTFRASGAGGQHVNKTESAIRITHIPTNTVVGCQSERSQAQNKETAMKMLMSKLAQQQAEQKAAKLGAIEKKKIEWGSQIRSYVLHPYKMVKDHRTDTESPQPEHVLDGDLIPFIESYLLWSHIQK